MPRQNLRPHNSSAMCPYDHGLQTLGHHERMGFREVIDRMRDVLKDIETYGAVYYDRDREVRDMVHRKFNDLIKMGYHLKTNRPTEMCQTIDKSEDTPGGGEAFHPDKVEKLNKMQPWECVICMDKMPTYACDPCGHQVLCEGCKSQYDNNGRGPNVGQRCPVCHKSVIKYIRIYAPQEYPWEALIKMGFREKASRLAYGKHEGNLFAAMEELKNRRKGKKGYTADEKSVQGPIQMIDLDNYQPPTIEIDSDSSDSGSRTSPLRRRPKGGSTGSSSSTTVPGSGNAAGRRGRKRKDPNEIVCLDSDSETEDVDQAPAPPILPPPFPNAEPVPAPNNANSNHNPLNRVRSPNSAPRLIPGYNLYFDREREERDHQNSVPREIRHHLENLNSSSSSSVRPMEPERQNSLSRNVVRHNQPERVNCLPMDNVRPNPLERIDALSRENRHREPGDNLNRYRRGLGNNDLDIFGNFAVGREPKRIKIEQGRRS